MLWLFPWNGNAFPGRRKGFLSILPRAYTWQAVQHWQKGRRKCPPFVQRSIADLIRRRCAAGLLIADALEADADRQEAEPKRLGGFMADLEKPRGNFRR